MTIYANDLVESFSSIESFAVGRVQSLDHGRMVDDVGLFRKYRRGDENDGRENVYQAMIHKDKDWIKDDPGCSLEIIFRSFSGVV
jgi:hypothetical protein